MLEKLFNLKGKTVIVTGGSRGIGETMVKALSEVGANVVVASRNIERCKDVVSSIEENGGNALAIELDVGSEESAKEMVQQTLDHFGSIDVLVNNAGISPFMSAIEKTKPSGFDKIMNINLRGALLCAQAVSEHMISKKSGKIINISSSSAAVPVKGIGVYAVSKTALIQLTKTLAFEWGKYNINVNSIAPGFMDAGVADLVQDLDGFFDDILHRTPLGRTGKATELIGTLLLLTSDASSYITGQTIFIDGGAGNC
ncbi:SDR family NAD(P)-dependent oxidoreductase [Alkalihalobacterium alkalinitrilicum]|uniref:SDR family NAD(P)-dependent oxidoreductase n=1 Tax=Alkalihalobacterium alkalinitrilicum TaxID=427920 RepID=UPI000995BFB5|nr:glucose 1-dehydrogenase [Alkalihalobacterium alkalinitrilicum]